MNELLFKLKKDGKTVGYLKIADGELLIGTQPNYVRFIVHHQFNTDGPYLWGAKYPMAGAKNAQQKEGHNTCSIKFDTIHPFVCKDRNDKDVFAEDKVKRIPFDNDPTRKIEGTVIWHYGFLQWVITIGTKTQYRFEDLADSEIFESELELIEEEE